MSQPQNIEEDGIVVPWTAISKDALRALIEEFVTRDPDADYGEAAVSLDVKVSQVLDQLKRGTALIVYDNRTETCGIIPKR